MYAVVGVERGEEFCGVRPGRGGGRSSRTAAGRMLTIEEGLAFLHAVPEALEKNKCFHTGASRGTDAAGAGAVDLRPGTAPGLVLGEQPPHLAGRRLGRGDGSQSLLPEVTRR